MNYTIYRLNNISDNTFLGALPPKSQSVADAPLTIYKEVVDIDETGAIYERHKKVYYGLSKYQFDNVENKLKEQKNFLEFSFLYDRINQTRIPLSDLIISANHSPQRYYSEIQNRVNTLQKIAKQRGLKPIFMTLTLPSEYHGYKTTKKGNLIANPKYNNTTQKKR